MAELFDLATEVSQMKRNLLNRALSVFTLLIATTMSSASGFDYVGKDSNEAVLKFSHAVEMTLIEEPTEDEAHDAIVKQMEHLFGPMSYGEYKAVPKGNYDIANIEISRKNRKTFIAKYEVSMIVVLEARVKEIYVVTLPVNPERIYKRAMVGTNNPCTDGHYQSEGDFWYFWSPERSGCKLREGRDYSLVNAAVLPLANTKKTYSEFHRMADENGVVTIDMLYGLDDPETNSWNPDDSSDVNAENYRYVAKKLKEMGFAGERLSLESIKEVALEVNSTQQPTVDVFTKEYPAVQGRNVKKVVVTMFFGASGISEQSSAFQYYFKRSLEKSTMMIYAGHSGLGGHLDLESIESMRGFTITPNKDRYQMLYFNSCTSYTYYNTMYFGRKKSSSDPKGTKNLDIVTNGLATYFSSIDETNLEMLRGVNNWSQNLEPLSYQEMARKMDSENLLGVNGDEDNPTEVPSSN